MAEPLDEGVAEGAEEEEAPVVKKEAAMQLGSLRLKSTVVTFSCWAF